MTWYNPLSWSKKAAIPDSKIPSVELGLRGDLPLGTEAGLRSDTELGTDSPGDLGLKKEPSFDEFSTPEAPQSLAEQKQMDHFSHPSQQTVMSENKDLEIISAKLDAIKATLESINHRIENLERIARG